jgi:hypothetical protein
MAQVLIIVLKSIRKHKKYGILSDVNMHNSLSLKIFKTIVCSIIEVFGVQVKQRMSFNFIFLPYH